MVPHPTVGAKAIIALSGLRVLNEIELPYTEQYAYGANTEFEAISTAMEAIFSRDPIAQHLKLQRII